METRKYKLTEESINVDGRTLHRIEALKDFGNVKKGDKGVSLKRRKTYLNVMIVGFMTMQRSMAMQASVIMQESITMQKYMAMQKPMVIQW